MGLFIVAAVQSHIYSYSPPSGCASALVSVSVALLLLRAALCQLL